MNPSVSIAAFFIFIYFESAFLDRLATIYVQLFRGISIPQITAMMFETPFLTV